jgi:UDP-glucose 4-epimerase
MRVLVLGGTGFIGSHVVDRLIVTKNEVRVFASFAERYRQRLSGVDYRYADFSDLPALAEALEGIDIVFHLISHTVPSSSNLDPVGDVQSNLVNTIKLLELMVAKKVNRIVFMSSGGTVYGVPNQIPITEDHPLNPICSYGVVKVAIENYIKLFHHAYGITYVIIRAANPFGERQGHIGVQGIIGTAFERIRSNTVLTIWGDGSIVRDYLYVDDLADLFVEAGTSGLSGIFNAGTGVGLTINEVLGSIEEVAGEKINKVYAENRSIDIPKSVLSIDKIRKEIGWEPKVPFMDGIRKTWNWYFANTQLSN